MKVNIFVTANTPEKALETGRAIAGFTLDESRAPYPFTKGMCIIYGTADTTYLQHPAIFLVEEDKDCECHTP